MNIVDSAHGAADPLLELATGRHRAGDLREARRLYRQLIEAAPGHAAALFRYGLLELQDAQPAAALTLIERAAAIDPEEPRYPAGLGQALQALGRWDAAAAAYRRALGTNPRSADLHFALGTVLQSQHRYADAMAAYQQAVGVEPQHFAALNNLGLCRQRCGLFAAAAAAYTQALALRPGEPGAMANLGTVLQALGRIDEAVRLLRAAVEREPESTPHAVNLGIALCRARDFGAAADILGRTVQRDAANAEAAFNLGNALSGVGRASDAAASYRKAVALRPGYADAWINLGNLHRQSGEFAAAAAAYDAALRAAPDSAAALNNAGCLLRTLGRLDDAEDMLRRGLQMHPGHAALHDNLGSVLKDLGELDAAIACFRTSLRLEPGNAVTHSNLVYALSFQSFQAQPILEECRRWERRFAAALPRSGGHPNERAPQRRLRIGYVSADFRDHCQSLFTLPLLSQHDHGAFEIFCYASAGRADEHTRRIAACADVWREAGSLDDAELAAAVRADGIDILVDLTMHMSNGRPMTFARKAAPIQVAWLAYPGTTGLGAMDYRISDPRLDPPGFESHYTERTFHLPESFWCYDPLSTGPEVGPLPALERGYLTLGCLNNPCKLTDHTLRLWGGVMHALPGARLLLLAPAGRHRQRLSERLAAHGMAAGRVDFLPYMNRADYLRSYQRIDVGLDTFPYNGHTTSLDALWMGVPTITRVGQTCVGRGGLSQLAQLGLLHLAAESDAAFVAAAIELGEDLPLLAQLRRDLRSRLTQSPLMDAPRFARSMEAAYRCMWKRYCGAGSSGAVA